METVTYDGTLSEVLVRRRSGNKIRAPFSVIGPMTNISMKRKAMKEDVFDLLDKVSKRAFSVFNNLKFNRSLVNNVCTYVATEEMDKTDKETLSRNMTELKNVGLIKVMKSKGIPAADGGSKQYYFANYRKTYIINPELIRCSDHDEAEYIWNYCGGASNVDSEMGA